MREVFASLLDHMHGDQPCVLVSAVGAEGSAPRKMQSHMLVNRDGRVCGTVGGGAVEGNSIAYAAQLLKSRESELCTFELYEHAAHDIGMICGGRVDVHFLYVCPEDEAVHKAAMAAVSAYDKGKDAWLMIELNKHSLTVFDGISSSGVGVPQPLLDQLNPSADVCRLDEAVYYHEQLVYADRVFIFGGGHVAQALVPVLASVGFRCVVIEDREEFCQKELFPHAQDVRLLGEQEWDSLLPIGKEDCFCIMTRGHKNDLACQAFALRTQAGYIGVIGSRRKVAAVNAQLSAKGFDDAQLARIVTPIGLEIGAVTPAEIAVSIAAQMIAHRAKSRNMKKSCMS